MASIRAVLLRTSLLALDRVAGPEQLRQLEHARPALFAQIRASSNLDWLPLELDLELSALVSECLGPETDRDRARCCLRTALDAPLLRPFVLGVETLFSLSPNAMLRQVPRGWRVLYRDAGTMRYEIEQGNQRLLIYESVPSELRDHPCYLDAIAGALEGTFDLCHAEGEITVEAVPDHPSSVCFRSSWW